MDDQARNFISEHRARLDAKHAAKDPNAGPPRDVPPPAQNAADSKGTVLPLFLGSDRLTGVAGLLTLHGSASVSFDLHRGTRHNFLCDEDFLPLIDDIASGKYVSVLIARPAVHVYSVARHMAEPGSGPPPPLYVAGALQRHLARPGARFLSRGVHQHQRHPPACLHCHEHVRARQSRHTLSNTPHPATPRCSTRPRAMRRQLFLFKLKGRSGFMPPSGDDGVPGPHPKVRHALYDLCPVPPRRDLAEVHLAAVLGEVCRDARAAQLALWCNHTGHHAQPLHGLDAAGGATTRRWLRPTRPRCARC